MALISFTIEDHTALGLDPNTGHVVFTPTRIHTNTGGGIGTMKPFTVQYTNSFDVELENTTAEWLWKISVNSPTPIIVGYYAITGDTNFKTLLQEEPDNAWWTKLNQLIAMGGGEPGQDGAPGTPGKDGSLVTLTAGEITKLPPGSTPTVSVTGSPTVKRLNVGVVTGDPGLDGSNVLPTDTAIAQAFNTPGSATETAFNDAFVDYGTASVIYARKLLPSNWVSGDSDGGAIAAACANGGHVVLPPGRIVVEQTIQPTKTLTLEGSGASLYGPASSPTTLDFVAGKDGVVLTGTGTVNSVLRGLNISSQAVKTGTTRGIVIDTGRVHVQDVSITRFGSHGIHIIPTTGNPHVVNTSGVVSIRDNGGDGLHITGQANACTFAGLDIGLNVGWGIWNEGRANVFMHPHILSNALGAIWDNGIGNAYLWPYVEADVNLVTDKIIMDTNSTGGHWLAGSYGKNEPTILATGGGLWTVITPQRMRRSLTIGAPSGKGSGKATVIEQGIVGADMGRLRMENADGSVGVSLMRWSETLFESMLEHRFVFGTRFGDSVGPVDKSGTGSPEGVVSARPGSTYRRVDGTAGASFYIKDSGLSTTGWRAL